MRMTTVSTLAVISTLGACATTKAGDSAGAVTCSADAAAALVGRIAPDDATILGLTGGTIVRRIAPGDPTTRDYRIERVTVTVANGRVVAASCG
jgi:hypothetical protein